MLGPKVVGGEHGHMRSDPSTLASQEGTLSALTKQCLIHEVHVPLFILISIAFSIVVAPNIAMSFHATQLVDSDVWMRSLIVAIMCDVFTADHVRMSQVSVYPLHVYLVIPLSSDI